MKTIFLSLALVFASNFVIGQQRISNIENFSGNGTEGSFFAELRKKGKTIPDLNTVGSVYIDEKFVPCTVYYEDEVVGDFYYRHNAFNDEVEIKDTQLPDEKESSLQTLKELRLVEKRDNDVLSLNAYRNKEGAVRNGYLYLIKEGEKYNLYTKNNVKFTEGTQPVNSLVRPTPNKFSHFTEFYYKTKDGKVANYISHRQGDFLDDFSKDLREPVKDYIKEEKINLKKQEDLVNLFTYLDSKS